MINISGSYTNSVKALLLTGMSVLLIACGAGGGAVDGESAAASTTIEGSAIKGVIENGVVRAFVAEDNFGVMELPAQASASSRTLADGSYSLTLNGDFSDATVVVEITADELTRMTCDVPEGCGLDAQGDAIDFGDKFALADDFSLRGVVTGVASGRVFSAHLSPLSHMAVAYANANIEGLSASSIAQAFAHIEDLMDLDSGALTLAPADITKLDTQSNLSKTEIELGVISAAFLSLVNTPDWDSVEEVLAHIDDKMSNAGQLASVNMGALRDVTLDDLFYNATDIVNDIVAAEPDSAYGDELAEVSAETSVSYEEVAQAEQTVDPVVIVSQPQSVEVSEGEGITLSIAANGGGTLSFQWRLNGQNVSGANASALVISAADLNDAGLYDVLVSNSVGTVVSSSAVVAVNEVVPSIQPAQIVAQPQSVEIEEGQQFSFSVAATGDALTYQWRKDGNAISGATGASLTIAAAELGDGGSYDVLVANSAGSVTSNAAELTVNAAQAVLAAVQLSWDIPLEREDGTALELYEINGYVIAYGTSSDNLSSTLSVSGATETTATIKELASNTYYFAIATIDSDGVQGNFSSVIEQTIL